MRDRKRHNQWTAHTYTMDTSNKSHQKSNLKNMIQPHKSSFSNYPNNFIPSLHQLYIISSQALYHLYTNFITSTSFQNSMLIHFVPPITLKYSFLSSSKASQYQIPHFLSAFLFLYLPSHLKYNTFQQIL